MSEIYTICNEVKAKILEGTLADKKQLIRDTIDNINKAIIILTGPRLNVAREDEVRGETGEIIQKLYPLVFRFNSQYLRLKHKPGWLNSLQVLKPGTTELTSSDRAAANFLYNPPIFDSDYGKITELSGNLRQHLNQLRPPPATFTMTGASRRRRKRRSTRRSRK
jgi:hypothetical protein